MKLPRIFFAAATALALGCSSQIVGNVGTGGGTTTGTGCTGAACACGPTAFVSRVTATGADKIDLVLVVDNSASMSDKQQILAQAIPDLIAGLVNPQCLDDTTAVPVAMQPAGPLDPCPAGSQRAFNPVLDMHVGLLSSSLGTFGSDGCPDKPPAACSGATPGSTSNDDHGHLVTRLDPCGAGNVPTYESQGFLAWDPAQKLMPPGEGQVGDLVSAGLVKSLHDLVLGDGQLGCGFESQNESWYRFLVDPTPYQSITLINNQVEVNGIDQALLDQRKDFLRPDSLLAIVNVTDETDTSIKQYSSYPLFAAPELHLPRARQECTTKGPTDPCCASCGQAAPTGCAPDPQCTSDPSYTQASENTSIRAFGLISHKARYGIEFFYQPSRYVQALTSPNVADVNGKMVPNPIFSNLDPAHYTGPVRDPSLVVYAAIVGVPWQLIARQKNGVPDLINGVSAVDPTQVGGFKTSHELNLLDAHGNSFWDDIAGDPENYVLAKSPYMVESTVPRAGTDPITGIAVSPPSSPNGTDPMNGHERTISNPPNDIEYACIFPILHPIDCSVPGTTCDCFGGFGSTTDNPLCEPNPNDNNNLTLQVRAKAYPGIKHLAIARGMGDQGVATSLCAKQITDPTAADYGYRPAIDAIVRRMTQGFRGPSFGGQCLAQALPSGGSTCRIIEATSSPTCSCDPARARTPIPTADQCFAAAVQANPLDESAHWNCFCEITPTAGADLTSCQTQATAPAANGWCYVDPAENAASAPLVAKCPTGEQHAVRFVGTGAPAAGATIFIACQ